MILCSGCGTENPAHARFCLGCGRPLLEIAGGESRRTVTVLFSDIVDSTALGESLDPEALQAVLSRYFGLMAAILDRHGGTVEKFIGDAVMAVFGLRTIHEDDALRAVRAALEMRDGLASLDEELRAELGVTIATRTGVHTGEVLAGDPTHRQALVTGDAVNTAARLEQAAGAGEILIGEATFTLVRGSFDAERVAPIAVKGKAEPVRAFRLVGPKTARPALGHGQAAPLVGRGPELATLRSAFERAVETRHPSLLTVVGPAGAGKSRLVAEFLAGIEHRAIVLRGRCLSYGEGITYWPLREILQTAAGIRDGDSAAEARRKLERSVEGITDGPVIAARLAGAIGMGGDAPVRQDEIFWAVRRAFAHLAAQGPVVVVVEDIHWAEPTFLELLRELIARSRGVPLVVVCPARTELLEREPGWGTGVPSATVVLERLPDEAAAALLASLPGGASIPPALRDRILASAEGNPLFLEEMARMLVEDGALTIDGLPAPDVDGVRVPPTIQALMAARIDGLPTSERSTAQRASVVGRVFERDEVVELTPPYARPEVAAAILGLLRRELLAPEAGSLPAHDAFKFRHILLRDAAYEGLRKAERAELHERFADWLERTAGDRLAEYEEIVGYHLGRAYRYRVELRQGGAATDRIGRRAAARLHGSARRARARGDSAAAVLLYRAVEGLPERDAADQTALLLDHGRALYDLGRFGPGGERAAAALGLAGSRGDRGPAAQARLLALDVALAGGSLVTFDPAIEAAIEEAMADAEASGDPMAQAQAWMAASARSWAEARIEDSEAELRHALTFARVVGDERLELEIEANLLVATFAGPAPATEVVEAARAVAERAAAHPSVRAEAGLVLGVSEAMLGRRDDALADVERAVGILEDLAQAGALVNGRTYVAWVHRLDGDLATAERVLRAALEEAISIGDRSLESFVSCRLAEALVNQGRYEEAEAPLAVAERDRHAATETRIVGAHARIRAARGDTGALADVDRLLEMVAGMPWLNVRSEACIDAAHALASLGRRADAERWAGEAIGLCERKQNLALAGRARALLEALAG